RTNVSAPLTRQTDAGDGRCGGKRARPSPAPTSARTPGAHPTSAFLRFQPFASLMPLELPPPPYSHPRIAPTTLLQSELLSGKVANRSPRSARPRAAATPAWAPSSILRAPFVRRR